MKPLHTVALTAAIALLASSTLSVAQDGTNAPPATLEKPAAAPQTSGAGTMPEGMGSTGWTGGSRGTTNSSPDPESASQQPEMATGADLKGSPKQFPAQQTPE